MAVALARNAHELRQHLQGNVLEGAGGAMEELGGASRCPKADGANGRVPSCQRAHAAGKLLGSVVGQERPKHTLGSLGEAAGAHLSKIELFRTKRVGDVEAPSGARPARIACLLVTNSPRERVLW